MRRYRTEIEIPADRCVVLHLPAQLPAGRAVVTVTIEEPEQAETAEADLDRQDIEWWEEFDDEGEDVGDDVDGDDESAAGPGPDAPIDVVSRPG